MPLNPPVRANTGVIKEEQFLHGQHITFTAGDLGQRGDFAAAILQPVDLHDQIDRAGDLTAQCGQRDLNPAIATIFSSRLVASRAELA